ncbi:c-type cytochrome [Devosia sp. RR2S18]|uniref:c-type cytochrome n=1 Tax=Devosia rhizosphaerae TaxID=3049774 RepID=UPI00254141C9|nr:c-type cytochrome [Devosia sp. RR2S18]WIJ26904.1 c-type cytochrome [Devosia sp. RR2S18]
MAGFIVRVLRASLIYVALGSTALYSQAAPLVPADILARPADIERGRGIAVGTYSDSPAGACFQCHGLDGAGDRAAAFPRLTGQVYQYLVKSLRDYASGERQSAIMEPIAKALSEQQMRDVSAFYAVQSDAPMPPAPEVEYDLLQLGGALAAVGSMERGIQGCINCHGPDGSGLAPSYPALAGQYAPYLEAQLLAWKNGTRDGDLHNIMSYIAQKMTDEEIRAVSIYYASIRPDGAPDRAGLWEFESVPELAGGLP